MYEKLKQVTCQSFSVEVTVSLACIFKKALEVQIIFVHCPLPGFIPRSKLKVTKPHKAQT